MHGRGRKLTWGRGHLKEVCSVFESPGGCGIIGKFLHMCSEQGMVAPPSAVLLAEHLRDLPGSL